MGKYKMPKSFKDEILNETDGIKVCDLINKYAKEYLLDDEIIQHEINLSNMPDFSENYYIRKKK